MINQVVITKKLQNFFISCGSISIAKLRQGLDTTTQYLNRYPNAFLYNWSSYRLSCGFAYGQLHKHLYMKFALKLLEITFIKTFTKHYFIGYTHVYTLFNFQG